MWVLKIVQKKNQQIKITNISYWKVLLTNSKVTNWNSFASVNVFTIVINENNVYVVFSK